MPRHSLLSINILTGFILVSLLVGLVAPRLDAQESGVLDQAIGVPVGPDALPRFVATGLKHHELQLQMVDVADLGSAQQALRVTVTEGKKPWDMGINVPTTQPVSRGDVMLATFQMRNVKSMTGQALVMFSFQKAEPNWDKSIWKQVAAGSEWTRISLPFLAKGSYLAAEAVANFSLALDDQTLEIADIKVLNFGPDFDIDTLPNSDTAYEGREADAPWRGLAATRIDKHRKADLTVTVLDRAGDPVPNAKVEVQMTRHAFPFGTAVAVKKLLLKDEDGERYRQELVNNFNAGGFESALKWNNYGTGSPAQIDEALNWLIEHDIDIHGNVMMWPSWRWIAPEVIQLKDQPEKFREAIEHYVSQTAARYRGRVDEWDVVNEPYTNHDVMDILGDQVMVDWYKLVHEANPEAKLYINDNEMVTSGGRTTKHLLAYKKLIRFLLENGSPLHGIGVQGHFSSALSSPEQVWNTLDQFAEFNLPIRVTEFDINHDDPQLQADFLRDFYTAAFAHESVAGIQTWGFWEGQHWRPQAALFDINWNLRPHGQAYRDLVYGQWWTDETGKTDSNGNLKIRGFLGDHRISITGPDGQTQVVNTPLGKSGQAVSVTLTDTTP